MRSLREISALAVIEDTWPCSQKPGPVRRTGRQHLLAYRDLALREAKRIVLIDGANDPEQIQTIIWETISSRFPEMAPVAK